MITLRGHRDLTREAVEAVAWDGQILALDPAVLDRVAAGQGRAGGGAGRWAAGLRGQHRHGLAGLGRSGPGRPGAHQRNLLLGPAGRGAGRDGGAGADAGSAATSSAPGLRALAACLDELVAPVERDRPLGPDLARLVAALERDELPLP